MLRAYSARIPKTNYTTANGVRTIIEFTGATGRSYCILEAHIGNVTSETATMELIEIVRKSGAGTGTAVTLEPLKPNDAAFGGSSRHNCTAEGTVSDSMQLEPWEIRLGWHYVPVPEARVWEDGAGILGIRIAEALEADLDIAGYVIVGVAS